MGARLRRFVSAIRKPVSPSQRRWSGWWFVLWGSWQLAFPEMVNRQNAQTAHAAAAALGCLILGVGFLLSAQIDGLKQ